jgi:hypothetical protein
MENTRKSFIKNYFFPVKINLGKRFSADIFFIVSLNANNLGLM